MIPALILPGLPSPRRKFRSYQRIRPSGLSSDLCDRTLTPMGRWTVNPVKLVRNLRAAARLGPTVRDRLGYLAWIYNDKALTRRNPTGRRG